MTAETNFRTLVLNLRTLPRPRLVFCFQRRRGDDSIRWNDTASRKGLSGGLRSTSINVNATHSARHSLKPLNISVAVMKSPSRPIGSCIIGPRA